MPNTSAYAQRRLVAMNIVLLGVLALVTVGGRPSDGAQPQPDRARGQYTVISGSLQGGNTDAIYIIDSTNQELVALDWNRANEQLTMIGYRNLARDSRRQQEER